MSRPGNWGRVALYLGIASLLLLILQYFLGLWTNVYAPAQFSTFDSGANYPPSLNVHIINGDVLFLLSVVALVFAALSKRVRTVLPAALLVVSVYVAGELGMAFVNSSPNSPIDSFGMGAMFLVALFSAGSLVMLSWRDRPAPTTGSGRTAAASQPS